MNIPIEIIYVIFEYADVRCCMCQDILNYYKFCSWNNKYYGHKKCIENLQKLML